MSSTVTIRPAVIGPLGPAELTCIRSWDTAGLSVLYIQLGERRAPTLLQKSLAGYLHVPETTAESQRITLIRMFLEEQRASGLTCLAYKLMEWLYRNPSAVPAQLPLWVAPLQTLPVLQSKREQQRVAAEVGLPVLESFFLVQGVEPAIEPVYYPIVLRPGEDAEVEPHFKMVLTENSEEVQHFLDSRTRLDAPLIAQRFVDGPNLVVHGARTKKGQHLHLAAFMASRKFAGVTLTLARVALPADIDAACRRFVDKISYVGVYHFELLWDPESDRYYFLEINGRLGGTTAKVFACGYDEPRYLLEAFGNTIAGEQLPDSVQTRRVCTNKRAVLRALLEAARGRKTIFDYAVRRSLWYPADLAYGLITWRDEIFLPGHFKTAIAYTVHATLPDRPRFGSSR